MIFSPKHRKAVCGHVASRFLQTALHFPQVLRTPMRKASNSHGAPLPYAASHERRAYSRFGHVMLWRTYGKRGRYFGGRGGTPPASLRFRALRKQCGNGQLLKYFCTLNIVRYEISNLPPVPINRGGCWRWKARPERSTKGEPASNATRKRSLTLPDKTGVSATEHPMPSGTKRCAKARNPKIASRQ